MADVPPAGIDRTRAHGFAHGLVLALSLVVFGPLLLAFLAAILAALLVGPIIFGHWCVVIAPAWEGFPLLALVALGAALYVISLFQGATWVRVLGLGLFLAPIAVVAVIRATSSGEWLPDVGPAIATVLVGLWLGLTVPGDVAARANRAASPVEARAADAASDGPARPGGRRRM